MTDANIVREWIEFGSEGLSADDRTRAAFDSLLAERDQLRERLEGAETKHRVDADAYAVLQAERDEALRLRNELNRVLVETRKERDRYRAALERLLKAGLLPDYWLVEIHQALAGNSSSAPEVRAPIVSTPILDDGTHLTT